MWVQRLDGVGLPGFVGVGERDPADQLGQIQNVGIGSLVLPLCALLLLAVAGFCLRRRGCQRCGLRSRAGSRQRQLRGLLLALFPALRVAQLVRQGQQGPTSPQRWTCRRSRGRLSAEGVVGLVPLGLLLR